MDGFLGFNSEKVESLSQTVNKSAQDSCTMIIERLESGVVKPISTCWYAPEGVEFFQGFATAVEKTGVEIKNIFDSFVKALEQAEHRWADNLKAQPTSLTPVGDCVMKLNVSSIQEKREDGNQGADPASVESVTGKLNDVKAGIESELNRIASDLNAETAFIGNGQGEAINECFKSLSKIISRLFEILTEGENNVQSNLKKAITKYGEVSQAVKKDFSNN